MMASLGSGLERSVLESLVPTLEAEGYHVLVQPPPFVLPPFMGSYRPDAVALKPGKNIAIEVISPVRSGTGKANKLQELFSPHRDWEFRIYYAPPRNADPAIAVADKESIQRVVANLSQIRETAGGVPALLTAWAALEAVGRVLVPSLLARPQTPQRLLEVLASEGYLTPDEADAMREIVHLRNRVAHGDFKDAVTGAHLDRIMETIKALVEMWPDQKAS
jgi:uncharacterized protein YutE (UPF0331/DUF86 family)